RAVRFDGHSPAAAITALTPAQLRSDGIEIDGEAGGHAFENHHERRSMRFARGQKSQHWRSFYPKKLRTLWRPAGDLERNRQASILHSRSVTRVSAHLDLIADRFLVYDDLTGVDLATGDRVELIFSVCGGPSEHVRWATRCERLARLHHRSIARL